MRAVYVLAVVCAFFVLLRSDLAHAQTTSPCVRVPLQASTHITLGEPDPTTGTNRGSASIQLPTLPTEIRFVTVRLKSSDPQVYADIRSLQITTTLFGTAVTH